MDPDFLPDRIVINGQVDRDIDLAALIAGEGIVYTDEDETTADEETED